MITNKIIKTIVLPTIMCIAIACTREEPVVENGGVQSFDCFSASIEDDPVTKLYFGNDGSVRWDLEDKIMVFSDTQPYPIDFFYKEDGRFHSVNGATVSGNHFYAYYSDYFSLKGGDRLSLSYYLPIVISPTFDSKRLPMIAKSDNNHFSFRQVGGILHLKYHWSDPVNEIVLKGNNDEVLCGPSTLDLLDDNPVLRIDSVYGQQYQYVSINFSQAENFDGEEVYIYLPVMSLENGFNVDFHGTSGTYSKSTKKKVSIHRAVMNTYKVDIDSEIEESVNNDKEALIALFNALDGSNWANKTNWCSTEPLDLWYGVTTNSLGRVIELYLSNNNLKGVLPSEIGNLECLEWLEMDNNLIQSPLPESFRNLSRLRGLHLSYNRLTGPLPEQIKYLTNLQSLYLEGPGMEENGDYVRLPDHEYLSGELPEWLADLKGLWNIDLSFNHFSGTLPVVISGLDLRVLDLSSNDFVGNLPDISQMKNLYRVSFANCYFTGEIPSSYASYLDEVEKNFAFLSYPIRKRIHVGGNCLSGPMPEAVFMHPNFSEFTSQLLVNQRDGYKIEIDETKVPACKHTFSTFKGDSLNLASFYNQAKYTLIARWAEWCPYSQSIIPGILKLSNQLRDAGLQTVWAYGGGNPSQRIQYMSQIGLVNEPYHIIESNDNFTYDAYDHAVWDEAGVGYGTPFFEVVDKDGYIVFIDDYTVNPNTYEEYRYYDQYSFSHKRSELEPFLIGLFTPDLYTSTDYSADGNVHTLQSASKGQGVNVVLMGDAFSDRLIADGTYKDVMEKAAEALFSEEPYKSYKDYFNVYYIDVVSKNEAYYGETALSTWYGSGTAVGGNDEKVFQYASTVLSNEQLDDALLIVMMNRDYYAGTCYMYYPYSGDYGRGPAVAYFPTSSDTVTFNGLVSHEAGGHGFAKLADEYAYENMGAIPEDEIQIRNALVPFGWWKNADFTGDPLEVKWAQFIADNRYDDENIGCYEGAFTYWTGAWRPTDASIMRYNTGGFNAPSRYAIWYRIHKLAYGEEWQGTYEDFVEYDKVNRTPAAVARRNQQRRNFVEKDFEPLAPPVIINQDWRDSLRSRP